MDRVAARCAKRVVFTSLANNLRQSVTAQLLKICATKQIYSTLKQSQARAFHQVLRNISQNYHNRSISQNYSPDVFEREGQDIQRPYSSPNQSRKKLRNQEKKIQPTKYKSKQQGERRTPRDQMKEIEEEEERQKKEREEVKGEQHIIERDRRSGYGEREKNKMKEMLKKIVKACVDKRKFLLSRGLKRWNQGVQTQRLRFLVFQEVIAERAFRRPLEMYFKKWRRQTKLKVVAGGERRAGLQLVGAVQRTWVRVRGQMVRKGFERWRLLR